MTKERKILSLKLAVIFALNIFIIILAQESVYGESANINPCVKLLAQVISTEATDEPYNAQVAIGAVILNRTFNAEFPDTVSEVIKEWEDADLLSDLNANTVITDSAYKAARDAYNGNDPTKGALYFREINTAPSKVIQSKELTAKIGSFLFYS